MVAPTRPSPSQSLRTTRSVSRPSLYTTTFVMLNVAAAKVKAEADSADDLKPEDDAQVEEEV